MKRKWNKVPGKIRIELYRHEGAIYDARKDRKLPAFLNGLQDDAELVIDFTSSGYYDPGSMYGGPDNLGYPPEGDDERLLVNAEINGLFLTPEQQGELFEFFRDEIEAEELDTELGGPDYD